MSNSVKLTIAVALFVWASAFVAIRQGLMGYSPEALALLRFLIASFCMGIIYLVLPKRHKVSLKDASLMLVSGMVGVGVYNLGLNNGELSINSGMASFITSQSPLITAALAILFLGERINLICGLGFMVSICGVTLIAYSVSGDFNWDVSLSYIFMATFASGFYTFTQKPFVEKYHALEVTAFYIWGGALFLLFYLPSLMHDFPLASWQATLTAAYLGVVPACVGLIAWSYVLKNISAARAGSFLYFLPFLATLLGWLYLGEEAPLLEILGGVIAIAGVWIVNHSYKVVDIATSDELVPEP